MRPSTDAMQIESLTGRKFGRLTVRRYVGKRKSSGGQQYWCCICDCLTTCRDCAGNGCTIRARQVNLMSGRTVSCGCSRTSSERQKLAACKIPAAVKTARARKGGLAKAKDKWVPISRAAYELGCGIERVQSLVQDGVLRERIVGGRSRISLMDIGRMVADSERKPKRECV